jgi:hypothetical protein
MGGKEMFIRMREEDYARIPLEQRLGFLSEKVIIPDEHKNLYETDSTYRELYGIYRKVKKKLEDYKFDKRHANNGSYTKQLPKLEG